MGIYTERFDTIEQVFELLDSKDFDERKSYNYSAIFQTYRDESIKRGNELEAQLAQINMEFLDFVISAGELHSKFSGTADNGMEVKYPNLLNFSEETYQHLIARFDSTQNTFLKIWYGHLLWLSPKKHRKYAMAAIEGYFQIINELIQTKSTERFFILDVIFYIKNLFTLSSQAHYLEVEVISIISFYLFEYQTAPHNRAQIFFRILPIIRQNKKKFRGIDKERIETHLWQIIDDPAGDPHLQIPLITEGSMFFIDKRIQRKFFFRLGQVHDSMTLQNQGNLSSIHHVEKAIQAYKAAGETKKVEELKSQLQKLTAEMDLTPIGIEIDQHAINREILAEAKRVSNLPTEAILAYLISSDSVLPQKVELEKQAEESIVAAPFMAMLNTTYHDHRGNPVKHISAAEKKNFYVHEDYRFYLEVYNTSLIGWIIYYSLLNGKLSSDILVEHFRKKSWLGQNITNRVAQKEKTYNWLTAIMPSIHSYLEKFRYLETTDYQCNYIMEVDSLVLKIEGMVRDLLYFKGVVPTKEISDDKGQITVQEKDINELIWHEQLSEHFSEDDLLFFRFLLVDKTGYNLRNEIAHSLILPQQYGVELMNLLFLVVLRLSAFQFEKT